MSTLAYILVFSFLGSIGALIGGILLLSKKEFAIKISHYLASFAAGVLIGSAFLDLLPEALEHGEETGGDINIFFWTLIGILTFFLLERFIHLFHHHHDFKEVPKTESKSSIPLIILGDTFHNFIDGIVIAATFLVDIKLGMITTLAVAAHEIPQEIGDFGLLLHKGLKRGQILLLNIVSASVSIIAALITYFIGESIESILPILLSLASGFFIYIALSDLIPEIHSEDRRNVALIETLLLILGVVIISISVSLIEHG